MPPSSPAMAVTDTSSDKRAIKKTARKRRTVSKTKLLHLKSLSDESSDDDVVYVVRRKSTAQSPASERRFDEENSPNDSNDGDEIKVECSLPDKSQQSRQTPQYQDTSQDDGDDICVSRSSAPVNFPHQSDTDASNDERQPAGLRYVKKPPKSCRETSNLMLGSLQLSAHMTVRIDDDDLFHISSVSQSSNKRFLTGWHLRHTKSISQFYEPSENELVILATTDVDALADPRLDRCKVTIEIPHALRKIDCSFIKYDARQLPPPAQLFCRHIIIQKLKPGGVTLELVCKSLDQTDCCVLANQQVHLATDISLLISWRGTLPVDVNKTRLFSRKQRMPTHDWKRKYTYGDICVGGGRSTRGAVMAGLEVRFLVDRDENAFETCRRNFKPGPRIYCWDVARFCKHDFNYDISVDILHISFPCQELSTAKRGGRVDYETLTLGKYLGRLIRKIRPRIVTLEQVPGILSKYGGYYFDEYVRQLTACGYDVRARVERLDEFSNVHKRRRLSIIASCPGEPLPTMPPRTHGPGLRPFTTIKDVLDVLAQTTIPDNMKYHRAKSGAPFDPNRPLLHCIKGTDGGDDSLHYSGLRGWNTAEFLALQGFPPGHKLFGKPAAKLKQIVNAVPPVYAEKLFRHIIEHLRASDARNARNAEQQDVPGIEMDIDE